MKITLSYLFALAALSLLSACGGGGGETPAPAPSATPAPTQDNPFGVKTSSMVEVKPADNYRPGSFEKIAFDYLNQERARCGFGYLKQVQALDMAAFNHSRYAVEVEIAHVETVGQPFFTGVNVLNRTVAAGYPHTDVSEVLISASGFTAQNGELAVKGLLNAPYHALGMFKGFTEVGTGTYNKQVTDANATRGVLTMNLGADSTNTGRQHPAAGSLRRYPCQGAVVMPNLFNETPSPVQNRDLRVNPIGSSIIVVSDIGTNISISQVTVTNAISSVTYPTLTPVSKANDHNARLPGNEVFIMVANPLPYDGSFNYTVSGTTNGIPFMFSDSFRTDSQRPGFN